MPMKVSSASTTAPSPPIGGRPPVRIASRIRWLMNQPVLTVTPSTRASWLLLIPFLLLHIRNTACNQTCSLTWLLSNTVPTYGHAGLLAAGVALIEARARGLSAHPFHALHGPAMRAHRTMRPHDAFQLRVGRFFILEIGRIEDAHAQTLLLAFGFGKYNIAFFISGA